MCVCVCKRTHTNTHTNTHTQIHTHTPRGILRPARCVWKSPLNVTCLLNSSLVAGYTSVCRYSISATSTSLISVAQIGAPTVPTVGDEGAIAQAAPAFSVMPYPCTTGASNATFKNWCKSYVCVCVCVCVCVLVCVCAWIYMVYLWDINDIYMECKTRKVPREHRVRVRDYRVHPPTHPHRVYTYITTTGARRPKGIFFFAALHARCVCVCMCVCVCVCICV
jgi:hypothetical protein